MNKINVFVIGLYHLAFFILLPVYFLTQSFNWILFIVSIILYAVSGVAITAGYHRLYSHKAYKLHWIVEVPILLFATLALQGSAIKWSHDHRNHHTHLDTQKDPYSITGGFWHAHMGWIFKDAIPVDKTLVADLFKNKLVAFQHRYYGLLVLFVHIALFEVSYFFSGDLFGTVFFIMLLRLFLLHHCTWFINSLAHMWGAKTYSRELTAVDNVIMAFFTFGEGYHNFHHTFMSDYRNGIRWYHFDPSKWLIWSLSQVGLASKLKRMDPNVIRKNLIKHDMDLFDRFDAIKHTQLYAHLVALQQSFEKTVSELQVAYREYQNLRRAKAPRVERKKVKILLRAKRRELRAYWKSWVTHVKCIERNFVLPHI